MMEVISEHNGLAVNAKEKRKKNARNRMLKRGDDVYTQDVMHCLIKKLLSIIRVGQTPIPSCIVMDIAVTMIGKLWL